MHMTLLSITDVARQAGVARHRIVYALGSGKLREPARIQNMRAFTPKDLQRVKEYFQAQSGRRNGHERH